jgi:hypothetical protein
MERSESVEPELISVRSLMEITIGDLMQVRTNLIQTSP